MDHEVDQETLVQDSGTFRKAIRLRHAVALYASSVFGSGILILPGLAAQIAGPASIIAWIALSAASYPMAFTFAYLSSRKPESGGIYTFSREAFGRRTAVVTGWLFALWVITGAPAVTLIAASYLGYAFPISRPETLIIAFGIVFSAFAVNIRGITVSNRVQLVLVSSIVVLLLLTITASIPYVRIANFQPFSNGITPIGSAAALIFWSFLGYENVSNVASEFANPERDFRRSIVYSVLLISSLYVAVAFVTIGTLAYSTGSDIAPFSSILVHVFGRYAAAGTAILAVFIIFGTVNAYTTGVSRVFYSVAKDGGFPSFMGKLNRRTGVPEGALVFLFLCIIPVFLVYFFFVVNLEAALLVPSGAAILIYVIGSASGARILGGGRRSRGDGRNRVFYFSIVSLAISLIILPFVGWYMIFSFLTVGGAMLYLRLRPRWLAGDGITKAQ